VKGSPPKGSKKEAGQGKIKLAEELHRQRIEDESLQRKVTEQESIRIESIKEEEELILRDDWSLDITMPHDSDMQEEAEIENGAILIPLLRNEAEEGDADEDEAENIFQESTYDEDEFHNLTGRHKHQEPFHVRLGHKIRLILT